jgi:hypothetical protein
MKIRLAKILRSGNLGTISTKAVKACALRRYPDSKNTLDQPAQVVHDSSLQEGADPFRVISQALSESIRRDMLP